MADSGGDGLTCDTRVIIHADNEAAGIAAEHGWLRAKYPGYKLGMQSLGQCAKSPADVLSITTTDGKTLEIYFDISSFFTN